MKNVIAFVVIAIFATSSFAGSWKDPEARFNTNKNFTNTSTIKWVVADNVQKACEAESRRRGLGGFGFGVDACSFWEGNSCIVITGQHSTKHEIGHEMRHCFQGSFH